MLAAIFGIPLARGALLQGDLPGHLEAIRASAERFWPLPWGWDPRYLGGAPVGILYPPLTTWVGAALAKIAGPEGGLTALLVAAVALTPVALHAAARGLGLRAREAGWAVPLAVAVLWLPGRGLGGSWHQTFVAGNAANAVALPLLAMVLATARRGLGRPACWAAPGAWLALTVMTHFLAGLAAAAVLVGWTLPGIGRRAVRRRAAAIAAVGCGGSAPFVVPFVRHLSEASPDGLPFAPPPSAAEWVAWAALAGAVALAGRRGRQALGGAAVAVTVVLLARAFVFPLVGPPPVRMEYHRFRLYAYLALVPAAALALRRRAKPRFHRAGTVAALALVGTLALFARYDAAGPPRVALPEVASLAAPGTRVLVLASPSAQAGSWHGAQLGIPSASGVPGVKGLFVEAAPAARRAFELERIASGPEAHPRWWAIAIDDPERLRALTDEQVAVRLAEFAVGVVVSREPVSPAIERLASGGARDLGDGWLAYAMPPVPRVVSLDLDLGDAHGALRLPIAAFSDWRVAGDAVLGRAAHGFVSVEGRGRVRLEIGPRLEEWTGLAIGLATWGWLLAVGFYRYRAAMRASS